MTYGLKRNLLLLPLLAPFLLSACASHSQLDTAMAENQQLRTENQQLQQQVAADKAQISRLQGAIKYTVNSDLLFPSGGWQMSPQGQQIIAKMASQLAADAGKQNPGQRLHR